MASKNRYVVGFSAIGSSGIELFKYGDRHDVPYREAKKIQKAHYMAAPTIYKLVEVKNVKKS